MKEPLLPAVESAADKRFMANLSNKGLGVAEATKAGLQHHPHSLENVLIYSKSAWYEHATISATNHWFFHFGLDNGVNIDQTDDPAKLNLDDLSRYQVLVLNSTTNFGEGLSAKRSSPGSGRATASSPSTPPQCITMSGIGMVRSSAAILSPTRIARRHGSWSIPLRSTIQP